MDYVVKYKISIEFESETYFYNEDSKDEVASFVKNMSKADVCYLLEDVNYDDIDIEIISVEEE